MKYKTTNKEQIDNNSLIVAFGYCDIQYIAQYLQANAYTSGTYGWKADFFHFQYFTISTGYAPLDYARTKRDKAQAKIIKKEIRKLENNIKNKKYAFQVNHDWNKGRKFIINKIEKIYLNAVKKTSDQ